MKNKRRERDKYKGGGLNRNNSLAWVRVKPFIRSEGTRPFLRSLPINQSQASEWYEGSC